MLRFFTRPDDDAASILSPHHSANNTRIYPEWQTHNDELEAAVYFVNGECQMILHRLESVKLLKRTTVGRFHAVYGHVTPVTQTERLLFVTLLEIQWLEGRCT